MADRVQKQQCTEKGRTSTVYGTWYPLLYRTHIRGLLYLVRKVLLQIGCAIFTLYRCRVLASQKINARGVFLIYSFVVTLTFPA